MRPYLAIIKDAFREAMASRVLWMLLVLITLLLIGLLPLGWKRQATTVLRREDIRDVRRMVDDLREPGDQAARKLVSKSMDDEFRKRVREYTPRSRRSLEDLRFAGRIADGFNRLIESDSFHDEAVWESVSWNSEGRELRKRPFAELATHEQRRLRRLFLEATYPGQFRPVAPESVAFAYAGREVGLVPPMPVDLAKRTVEQITMAFLGFVVGFMGILAGILVTAPIIPQTFSSGTLFLLLSKPISRPGVFLAKYLGGCAFILISAGYLILGLYAILGVRLQYWKPQLLYAIPMFLFLFCIYYSVSALAGLIWRSTVMAIVATVLFWLLCTVVGASKEMIELFGIRSQRITELVVAGEELFCMRQTGIAERWRASEQAWRPMWATGDGRENFRAQLLAGRQELTLAWDAPRQRVVGLKPQWPQPRIFVGEAAEGWVPAEVSPGPREASLLQHLADGRLVAVGSEGISRLADDLQPAEPGYSILGFEIPVPGPKNYELAMEPEAKGGPGGWADDPLVTFDVPSQAFVRYVRGELSWWQANAQGNFAKVASRELESPREIVAIAAAGDRVLLMDEQGSPRWESRDSQAAQPDIRDPYPETPPLKVAVSQDGRWWAALFANDRLWLFDRERNEDVSHRLPFQGQLNAFAFTPDHQLAVVDARSAVQMLRLTNFETVQSGAPPLSLLERVYWYVLRPVYTVFPKPARLNSTIDYLLTGKAVSPVGFGPPELRYQQIYRDPWGPVWSSAAFTAAILAIGCVYMVRQEF